jgi:hypothetical protein
MTFSAKQGKYWTDHMVKMPMMAGGQDDILTCAPLLQSCDLVRSEGQGMCRNIQVWLRQSKTKDHSGTMDAVQSILRTSDI